MLPGLVGQGPVFPEGEADEDGAGGPPPSENSERQRLKTYRANDWDEDKHPRAADGEFAAAGSGKKKADAPAGDSRQRIPSLPGQTDIFGGFDRPTAKHLGERLGELRLPPVQAKVVQEAFDRHADTPDLELMQTLDKSGNRVVIATFTADRKMFHGVAKGQKYMEVIAPDGSRTTAPFAVDIDGRPRRWHVQPVGLFEELPEGGAASETTSTPAAKPSPAAPPSPPAPQPTPETLATHERIVRERPDVAIPLIDTGDWHHIHGQAAVKAAKALRQRPSSMPDGTPFLSLASRDLQTHLNALVAKGYRVAISDPISAPAPAPQPAPAAKVPPQPTFFETMKPKKGEDARQGMLFRRPGEPETYGKDAAGHEHSPESGRFMAANKGDGGGGGGVDSGSPERKKPRPAEPTENWQEKLAELVSTATSFRPGRRPNGWKSEPIVFRVVDTEEAQRIREATGLETEGFRFEIREDELRHLWKNHGPRGKKLSVDDLPLSVEDLRSIPGITASPDRIDAEFDAKANEWFIRFQKRVNGTITIAEMYGGRHRRLRVYSAWKKKAAKKKYGLRPIPASTRPKRSRSSQAKRCLDRSPTGIVRYGGGPVKHNPREFDRHMLRRGILVELEHTEDVRTAAAIAMDHLAENPDYYRDVEPSAAGRERLVQYAKRRQDAAGQMSLFDEEKHPRAEDGKFRGKTAAGAQNRARGRRPGTHQSARALIADALADPTSKGWIGFRQVNRQEAKRLNRHAKKVGVANLRGEEVVELADGQQPAGAVDVRPPLFSARVMGRCRFFGQEGSPRILSRHLAIAFRRRPSDTFCSGPCEGILAGGSKSLPVSDVEPVGPVRAAVYFRALSWSYLGVGRVNFISVHGRRVFPLVIASSTKMNPLTRPVVDPTWLL